MLLSSNEAMDHGIDVSLNSTHQRTGSIDRVSPETVIGIRPAEVADVSEEDVNLKPKAEVLESSKIFDRDSPETVIGKRSAEAAGVSGEDADLKPKAEVLESKIIAAEAEKQSCVIDLKCGDGGGGGENWDEERVCRICHLNSDQSMESSTDLIQLGCGCKDELGIAHSHCAEAWFKLKGNRLCEICGDTAKNITGVGDNRFMDEWNESRYPGSNTSSDRGGGCWRGQPFCNFLMACLVIAFVLPWFFRMNMF